MEEGTNKGGILADDMGLGKTISTLALMLSRPSADRLCKVCFFSHHSVYILMFSEHSDSWAGCFGATMGAGNPFEGQSLPQIERPHDSRPEKES